VPFLGEKKAQKNPKDCAWHISSFIVAKFWLWRFKAWKPYGDRAAL